jgi:hypothetical protein
MIKWWWIPYFFGASEAHMQQYRKLFSRTFKFLPPIDDHLIPDAQHCVLHGLTVIALILTGRAVFSA